jgi:branched-chain amino acid transport system substrate-binding protein
MQAKPFRILCLPLVGTGCRRDDAIKFLTNWKTADSPRGPISIDPATRDSIINVYLRRTEMKDGKLANIEFETIPNVKDPWKEFNPPK